SPRLGRERRVAPVVPPPSPRAHPIPAPFADGVAPAVAGAFRMGWWEHSPAEARIASFATGVPPDVGALRVWPVLPYRLDTPPSTCAAPTHNRHLCRGMGRRVPEFYHP